MLVRVFLFLCLQGRRSTFNNVRLTPTLVDFILLVWCFVVVSLDRLAITGEPCYSILELKWHILLMLWHGAETKTFSYTRLYTSRTEMRSDTVYEVIVIYGGIWCFCCAQKMTGDQMKRSFCRSCLLCYLCFTLCLGGLTESSWFFLVSFCFSRFHPEMHMIWCLFFFLL